MEWAIFRILCSLGGGHPDILGARGPALTQANTETWVMEQTKLDEQYKHLEQPADLRDVDMTGADDEENTGPDISHSTAEVQPADYPGPDIEFEPDWSNESIDPSVWSLEDPSDELQWDPAEEEGVNPDSSRRSPPTEDSLGGKFVTIVDSTGIHHLPIIYCHCPESPPHDEQALGAKLFPASFTNISTVFTFSVLEHFRLENLECKTTPYQFYQKLRRLTNSSFPQSVPNRYAELRRLSREWRQLQKRKWHGMVYDPRPRGPGEMAIFCAACPQPGVNLKPEWILDKDK